MRGTSARNADNVRKKLHDIFHQIGLKITAQVNHQLVNFLDITLDLTNGKFTPYRKPNNEPLYVNSRSNHPPSIIKQIPKSINQRLSTLSSDQQSFEESKPFYENALKQSDYNVSLQYSTTTTASTTTPPSTKRRRRRNVIWYNPPFSKSVKSNVARNFLYNFSKNTFQILIHCTNCSTAKYRQS